MGRKLEKTFYRACRAGLPNTALPMRLIHSFVAAQMPDEQGLRAFLVSKDFSSPKILCDTAHALALQFDRCAMRRCQVRSCPSVLQGCKLRPLSQPALNKKALKSLKPDLVIV